MLKLKYFIKHNGIIKILIRKEEIIPPNIAAAIDLCEFAKGLTINGTNAIIVVKVVIIIGRIRRFAPLITANMEFLPDTICISLASNRIKPLLTTNPKRVIKPRIAPESKFILKIAIINPVPDKENGIESIIINGRENDSNCAPIVI